MIACIVAVILSTLAFAAPTAAANPLHTLAKRTNSSTQLGLCDLNTAQMNTYGLPAVSAGLTLQTITIGRGTQNYTCADSTSNTKPVLIGAVATLFNVTCLAGPYQSLLQELPGVSLKFPAPDYTAAASAASAYLSGHHYFTNTTTPTFNFDTTAHQWGIVECAKNASTNSTGDITKDIANLKLLAKTRQGTTISEVYRLNAAGGQPPKTCETQPAAFEVEYAAEYWFYSNPELPAYS